jgi:hypothetical protein
MLRLPGGHRFEVDTQAAAKSIAYPTGHAVPLSMGVRPIAEHSDSRAVRMARLSAHARS